MKETCIAGWISNGYVHENYPNFVYVRPYCKTQTGKPEFTEGDSRVPINEDVPATFDDGSTTKTVEGVGTYTVAPDGTVTFVPEKSFTGTGTGVAVKRVDKNGTPITATYTPTVTPVLHL